MQLEPFACDDDIRRTSSCDRVSNKTNTAKASVAHLTRVLDLLDPPPDLKESSSSSVFFLLCEDTSGEVPEEVEGLAIAQDGRTDTRAKFNIERRILLTAFAGRCPTRRSEMVQRSSHPYLSRLVIDHT